MGEACRFSERATICVLLWLTLYLSIALRVLLLVLLHVAKHNQSHLCTCDAPCAFGMILEDAAAAGPVLNLCNMTDDKTQTDLCFMHHAVPDPETQGTIAHTICGMRIN